MSVGANGGSNYWDESLLSSTQNASSVSSLLNQSNELVLADLNRLSNTDSGFVSIHSQRNSSYSKRSSQQSTVSAQWTTAQQAYAKQSATENHVVKYESHAQTSCNSTQTSMKTERSLYDCSGLSVDEVDCCLRNEDDLPPAIPQKTKRKSDRQPSPYDNVPDGNLGELSFHTFTISLQHTNILLQILVVVTYFTVT